MNVQLNNLGLTEDEVNSLLYEENVYDEDDNERFIVVKKKFLSNDSEKSSVEYEVTIQEVATGKYYKARLGESPWVEQEEHNARQTWKEVQKKQKVSYDFE